MEVSVVKNRSLILITAVVDVALRFTCHVGIAQRCLGAPYENTSLLAWLLWIDEQV